MRHATPARRYAPYGEQCNGRNAHNRARDKSWREVAKLDDVVTGLHRYSHQPIVSRLQLDGLAVNRGGPAILVGLADHKRLVAIRPFL